MTRTTAICSATIAVVLAGALCAAALWGAPSQPQKAGPDLSVVRPVQQLMAAGRLEEARLKVRELMLAHLDEPEVQQELYWLLGSILLGMGRFDQAETAAEHLEELLHVHPPAAPSLRDRAIALRFRADMGARRFAEAREAATPLLARPESDPGLVVGLGYVAHAYLAENRLDDALSFLDERFKAAKTPQVKGGALLVSSLVRFRAGQKEAASELLTRVATEYPTLKPQAEAMRAAAEGAAPGSGCGSPAAGAQAGCGCGSAKAPAGCGSGSPEAAPSAQPPPSGGCCGPSEPKQ